MTPFLAENDDTYRRRSFSRKFLNFFNDTIVDSPSTLMRIITKKSFPNVFCAISLLS